MPIVQAQNVLLTYAIATLKQTRNFILLSFFLIFLNNVFFPCFANINLFRLVLVFVRLSAKFHIICYKHLSIGSLV